MQRNKGRIVKCQLLPLFAVVNNYNPDCFFCSNKEIKNGKTDDTRMPRA